MLRHSFAITNLKSGLNDVPVCVILELTCQSELRVESSIGKDTIRRLLIVNRGLEREDIAVDLIVSVTKFLTRFQ